MSMWPKEHGAYGEVTLPLVTALAAGGVTAAGALFAAAVVAAFLAHEPVVVLLGGRGVRARREQARRALIWAGICLGAAAAAGISAFIIVPPAARAAFAIPALPAAVLAAATLRGAEKSSIGEGAASLAFAGAAVPVVVSAGGTYTQAAAIAVPFALLFVASTLAVRVVIVRVRGGGDPKRAAATRLAALGISAAAIALLAAAAALRALPASVLATSAPGLLVAAAVALKPPSPLHLRRLGWTLVGVSVLTAAGVLVATTA